MDGRPAALTELPPGPSHRPPAWRLLPRFVVRTPGFPFGLLDVLDFPASAEAAARVAAVRERLQERRRSFLEETFPALCREETGMGRDRATFKSWYRLARDVRRSLPAGPERIREVRDRHGRADLAEALLALDADADSAERVEADGERAFTAELAERRAALRALVEDTRVQEALWLSNPAFQQVGWPYLLRHWDPASRPAKVKHLERRLYAYLQRFCAKNDTTSFFGPLDYGRFEPGEAGYSCAPRPVRARRAFFAYWGVEALARRIAGEAAFRPHLRPRRAPMRTGRPPPSDPEGRMLHDRADGERTVSDLATGLGWSVERTLLALDRLAGEGFVLTDLPVPPSELDPLAFLHREVQAFAESGRRAEWLEGLEELLSATRRFETASLAERQEILALTEHRHAEMAGAVVPRRQGRMFEDRVLLYEECLGDLENFRLGEADRDRMLRDLTPVASLCAAAGMLRLRDLRASAAALLGKIAPEGSPVSFVRFAAAWRRRHPGPPASPGAERLAASLAALVRQRAGGPAVRLEPLELAALCAAHETAQAPVMPPEPVLMSPDLMLAAARPEAVARGDYQLVLGELHHGAQSVGWMLCLAEDRAGWEADLAACLPVPGEHGIPANLVLHRRMKTAPPELPGPSVQASGAAGRHPRIDLRDLLVVPGPAGPELRAPGWDGPLRFYPPAFGVPAASYAPFACFSLPMAEAPRVRLGRHTARIEVGEVVYQRERWDLPAAEVPTGGLAGTSFRLMADMASFRRRIGLPDRVFVRTPAEPKPVYVGFASYFACELLAHLASTAETLSFEEMWPDRDRLWLRRPDGRYCSELRMTLSSGAGTVGLRR